MVIKKWIILLMVILISSLATANTEKEVKQSKYCFEGRLCEERPAKSSLLDPDYYVYDPSAINVVTDYISIGYNLLKGNPEGEFSVGEIDPGLNLARKIFKFTYDQGKQVYYHGQIVDIPDQLTFKEVSSCASKVSVKLYSGTKSYQTKLDIKVKAEASGSGGMFDFRFSTSTGYSEAHQQTSKKEKALFDKEIICTQGYVRYNLDEALERHYTVEDDFFFAVKHLPTDYVEADYMRFLDEWGTHFLLETNFGGRLLNRSQSTYKETYDYASQSVESSISAGGSYGGYSGSFEVDVNTFNEQVTTEAEFGSFQYTQYGGSTIVRNEEGGFEVPPNDEKVPIPITVVLKPITLALDERLWPTDPDDPDPDMAISDKRKLTVKRQNLERASNRYPEWSNAPKSYDSPILIPNAWPDGKYSLQQPDSGCPASGDQFVWKTGWLFQDNEDDDTNNYFDNPHMAGSFSHSYNIQTEYCTKTDTFGDYGLKWPKGTYCVAQRGGGCPHGFYGGYIFWDDEDHGNTNKHGGSLPDGGYGSDTRVQFCCRNDGSVRTPINLPRDKPFYLYPYGDGECQAVNGMTSRLEYVRFDDDDYSNNDEKVGMHPYALESENTRLYYCYYY